MKLTFPGKTEITLPCNCSLEQLAAQLQAFTDDYLYVIDDVILSSVSNLDMILPGNRRLESATGPGFYIRDYNTEQLICCFREELKDRFLRPALSSPPEARFDKRGKVSSECVDMFSPIEVAPSIRSIHTL